MGGSKSKSSDMSHRVPPSKSRVTEQDRAILQLKQMRDKLRQYTERIESQLDREKQVAKALVNSGNIEKAKRLLKKKRFYEKNLENADAQLDKIDQLTHNLEFAQIEQEVVNGLRMGNECLKKLNEMMSLDEIEQVMDDTRESIEHQRQIDRLISGEFANENNIDEELDAELNEILMAAMPDAPKDNLPAAVAVESDESTTERIATTNATKPEKSKKILVIAE